MLKDSLGKNISCGCHLKNINAYDKSKKYHKKRNEEAINKIVGNIYCNFKVLELTEQNNKIYNNTKYNVECIICGFKTIYGRNHLVKSKTLICKGCLDINNKNNIGKKFGKLTITHIVKNKNKILYKSKCDCGGERVCKLYRLYNGHITSCGCSLNNINKHITKSIILKRAKSRMTNNDKIWVYNRYMKNMQGCFKKYAKKNDTISLFKFFQLSQENCHYCGIKPQNIFDFYNQKETEFLYNGLDRINQKEPHTLENCITCCKTCNYLKGTQNYNEFIKWINKINFNNRIFSYNKIDKYDINKKYLVNDAYRYYSLDTDIDIYTFSKLIMEPCYYCNDIGVNSRKGFRYNGLDRIDNTKGHELSNIVPCCKICNFSKKDFTKEEWYTQIRNIKEYLSLN